MDKKQIESFVGAAYPGYQDFMRNFITPIFDGAEIDDWRGAPQMNDDLKGLADRSGVQDIRLCAQVNTGYTTFRVYDVTVKDRVLLKRNRVTVQQLVRKIAAGGNAFMAFHHAKGGGEWRLSFFQGVAGSETSARRHTFLLGPDQNLRTVTDNLLRLRETLVQNGGLEDKDFVRCFDVEALSDEFFAKYKAHYEKFCLYVTEARDAKAKELFRSFGKDGKRVRDYVKKMMGRLVFLQFLQKKGWLGVPVGGRWGEGDRYFLQNLFAKASKQQQEDFLDTVLEPLFFKALNTDRTKRGDVYDTGVKGYGKNGKVRIPYLNGGLFTNDDEDDFKSVFPATLFSDEANRENPDPAKCGVLDFFAQYNFTIDENDPTEAEVGVDPEMLSRIFENLLEDNKDKGAFYTPKPVVDYMCRQSLIAYLQADAPDIDKPTIEKFVKTHELVVSAARADRGGRGTIALSARLLAKLKSVKICDPAIGSGAFPMGLLRELYFCRAALGDPLAEHPAELKKDIIENNIYGVDIEKGAVDIARLRFWLSLVVDEETPRALPNLDFKIMQGNSLLESYKGVDMSEIAKDEEEVEVCGVKMKVQHPQRTKFKKLLHEYFDCHDVGQKKKMKEQIEKSVVSLITENASGNRKQGTGLRKEDFDGIATSANDMFFLWHTWFSDVFEQGGFNIVIGNPPYISSETQLSNPVLKAQREALIESGCYKSLYQKWDLFIPFIELGIQRCRSNGVCSMIVPFPFTNQKYGKVLRRMMVEEFDLFELVDLNGTKIFENATVSNCIPFVKIATPTGKTWISKIEEKSKIVRSFEQLHTNLVQDNKNFVWNTTQEKRETDRHTDMHVLGDFCYISYGLRPNSDEKSAKGEFKKTDLISDLDDGKPRRKYVEAKDISKYVIHRIRFLEYGTERSPGKLTRPTFNELYEHDKIMFNVLGDLTGTLDVQRLVHNHSLIACVKWHDLHGVDNKSISASIKKFSVMSRDEMEKLSTTVDLRYLLGVMNSRYATWLLRNLRGGDYHIYPEHVRNIPIPSATLAQQKTIIVLVDEILAAKKENPEADTSVLEKQIDDLVFDLYGLEESERDIIRQAVE